MVTGAARPAYAVAAATPDPELPALTIEDLGILRSVDDPPGQGVVITITPTYSGCPAMREIAADIEARLHRAGFPRVTVATRLAPPWSTDWITAEGRRKLAAAGIAPPSAAPSRAGPVPLTLAYPPPASALAAGPLSSGPLAPGPLAPGCPRCGSADTRLTAQFGATACKSLHRCAACGEPFESVKPL